MVFGITGFGAAIMAVPVLVHVLPLSTAVPMILMTDLVATLAVGLRQRHEIDRGELLRLMLPMLLGVSMGVQALSLLPASVLLLSLGLFVVAHSVWGLWGQSAFTHRIGSGWAYVAGTLGGVFGAAFGTGGPVYMVYLMRRIENAETLRATMAVVVFISAVLRLSAFAVSGMLVDAQLHMLALGMVPFCMIGVVLGSKMRKRLSPVRLKRTMLQLLLVSGASVIYRAWLT